MHQQLINDILKQEQLSDHDIFLCRELFEPVNISKNTVIEESGYIPQYLYYIISGFMRLFYYDENGNETTTHINCPNGFFCSFAEFLNQKRSPVNVECITNCSLLRISRSNYIHMMEQSPAWKDFALFVLQESMHYNETRAKNLATLTAEQRYLQLLDSYPEIIQNVPLQYIASFLGIKPESLSRIRRNVIN